MPVHSLANIHLYNSMQNTDPAAKLVQKKKKKKKVENQLNSAFCLNSRQRESDTKVSGKIQIQLYFNQKTWNYLLSTQPKTLLLEKVKNSIDH